MSPVSAIISLGDSGRGMEVIIAASRAWLAMYLLNKSTCTAVTHTELARPRNNPCRKCFDGRCLAMM